jgi:hypothetical protein
MALPDIAGSGDRMFFMETSGEGGGLLSLAQ